MTLGEKIKEARKKCNLSQEQLSEKLNVSRSAVAKWETDKGLPDIDNLKALSQFLNVSVDYLIKDEENPVGEIVTKEPYDIKNYGKGLKKTKKDRLMLEKYPDWKINTVLGKPVLTKSEKITDFVLGFFTDAPYGIPDIINGFKNTDKEFYLIEKDGTQLFVTVTDEFIETRKLTTPITEKKFTLYGWEFMKCPYQFEKLQRKSES